MERVDKSMIKQKSESPLENTVARIHELTVDIDLKRYRGKGKILSLKSGYNPNSSSIGSVVFILSTKVLTFSAAFGLVAGFIYSVFGKNEKNADEKKCIKETEK